MRDSSPQEHARRRVALVHSQILQFRRGFHDALRSELDARDIDLLLVHGFPTGDEAAKQDAITVEWAHHTDNRVIRLGRKELVWQPCIRLIRHADLVVTVQQSALLHNYLLLARQVSGRQRIAFWGHGKNLASANASAVGEAIKRCMSRRVHWWFAYTEASARIVRALEFPPERVTVVRNAIDTRTLLRQAAEVSDAERNEVRARLGLSGRNVAIFSGGLYDLKRLPFLFEACRHVRAALPDFELLVLGAGPQRDLVASAADRHPWIHYVGPTFGAKKVAYFSVSKLFLLPGRVGLAILDAFALGTPLVTLADSAHSPEIEYLRPGRNGLLLPNGTDPVGYAATIIELLRDEERRSRLAAAGRQDAQRYSIEEMAARFAHGVEAALAAPSRYPARAAGARAAPD